MKLSDRKFILTIFCRLALLSKLEHAFNFLKIDKRFDLKQIEEELEDSWIVIKNDKTLQNEVIDFANPSFKTVVSDSGSMFGLFIVKKRFQKRAYEAAYKSNVLLKTWEEFIEMIEKNWPIRKIIHLSVYTDSFDVPTEKLTEKELQEYKKLITGSIQQYITLRTLEMNSLEKEYMEFDGKIFQSIR